VADRHARERLCYVFTVRCTCSPDTLTEPVQLPEIEWPPPINMALTMDERLSHWDSFVKASPRDMTGYDLRVIAFGWKLADHLREVFGD
jgi:hypothetical protein